MNGQATPLCSICWETLGKYGGPVTLPCGHNGCLHCMAQLQRAKAECPLCRAAFPSGTPLVVNHELRDLVALATALGTVEQNDGWQAVTSQVPRKGVSGELLEGEAEKENGVSLVPSAPPAHMSLSAVLEGDGDLLSLEPPTWVPDSHATSCNRCRAGFRPLARTRHHCRLCGGIFCGACSSGKMLLPPKFRQATPQRVCTNCAALLLPLQPFLAGTVSQAVQPAVHDVTDASALRSWFNPPMAASLAAELYKATNIVRSFAAVGSRAPDAAVPAAILDGAAGFAILSVAKGGCGWSVAAGTGLVVARKPGGSWTPPSALALYSCGWGLQFGGVLSDLLIVLRNQAAVAAFCGTVHCGLAGGVNLAVGPLGRQAEVTMQVGLGGAAVCYSYSCSRGAFAGVSIDGSLLTTRSDVNLDFYGRLLSAKQLLMGDNVSAPVAADALYTALDDLMARAGALSAERRQRLEAGRQQQAAAAAAQPTLCLAAAHSAALPASPARPGSRAALWAARDEERPRAAAAAAAAAHARPRSAERAAPADQMLAAAAVEDEHEDDMGFPGLFAD
ncbi:probable SH3 domain-containing YSC84-like protein 1 at C-terminar half [Coccomyxa sp. Obi]|nr:probable SH3 domain-containing YSC84-like protein 1 at C-terminar half [Coccomyxa sp. Obi]